jgi:hypothetical protein
MSGRSEALDRVLLDQGATITVWAAGWPPVSRWERFWGAAQAAAYHYLRLARFIATGRN